MNKLRHLGTPRHLRHVAIIPDGNRRFGKIHHLDVGAGHERGAKTAERVLKVALERDIPYLTIWGLSMKNIRERPQDELDALYEIFRRYFLRVARSKTIRENRVRVQVIGRWEEFLPPKTIKAVHTALNATRDYGRHTLTILLAYDATDEREAATNTAIRNCNTAKPIDETFVKQFSWSQNLPDVDLIIRTGEVDLGFVHLSGNILPFHTKESLIAYTPTFWPSFSPEFGLILDRYEIVEQRHGR